MVTEHEIQSERPSVGKRIREWVAFSFGLLGAILGLLGYIESQKIVDIENKIKVAQLLADAWDLIGEEEGAVFITLETRRSLVDRASLNRANRKIDQALLRDPNDSRAHRYKGMYLELTGKLDEALEEYEKAIDLDPDNNQAYNGLGAVYLKSGQTDKATIAFRKAIELEPDEYSAYNNLGFTLLRQGDSRHLKTP